MGSSASSDGPSASKAYRNSLITRTEWEQLLEFENEIKHITLGGAVLPFHFQEPSSGALVIAKRAAGFTPAVTQGPTESSGTARINPSARQNTGGSTYRAQSDDSPPTAGDCGTALVVPLPAPVLPGQSITVEIQFNFRLPQTVATSPPVANSAEYFDMYYKRVMSYGSASPAGASVAMADGSVRFLASSTNLLTLQELSTMASGNVVPGEW